MPEGPSTDRKSISVEAGNGMVLNIFIFEVYLSTKENTLQVFQNHAYKKTVQNSVQFGQHKKCQHF